MTIYSPHLPNFYAILGVEPDASPAEIKQAFRSLVQRFHPALHALDAQVVWEAEIMIEKINEAYAVLSDSILRWRYDALRLEAPNYPSQISPELQKNNVILVSEGDVWQPEMLLSAFPGQHLLTLLQQHLSGQSSGGSPKSSGDPRKQLMGALSKATLLPVPFCLSTVASAFFWHLGQVTGHMWLAGLTAVLAYPLLLIPLLLRLLLPISYRPLLSLKQKLVGMPVILFSALLLSWLWVALMDHGGSSASPFDLYWWCALISAACICLAYF